MIVRDHNGEIILSACRHLVSCRDALAAELKALLEGISLLALVQQTRVDRSGLFGDNQRTKS
jgi:hypothetical protein